MKKVLSLLLCVLLAFSTVLAFNGCSKKDDEEKEEITKKERTTEIEETTEEEITKIKLKKDTRPDEEKIIGSWKGEFDFTKKMNDKFLKDIGEEVDSGSLKIPYVFIFNDDGTGSIEYDENRNSEVLKEFQENFSREYLQKIEKEAAQSGITLADAMSALGVKTKEELISKMIEEEENGIEGIFEAFKPDLDQEFFYKINDGKILMGEYEDDYDKTIEYLLTDEDLLIIKSYDGQEEDSFGMLPATFTRQ